MAKNLRKSHTPSQLKSNSKSTSSTAGRFVKRMESPLSSHPHSK
jgi:hypothetical protein